MFDIALFLETPIINPDDFDIYDEILTAMLETPYINIDDLTIEIPSFEL